MTIRSWSKEKAKEINRRAFEMKLAKLQKSSEILNKWNKELSQVLNPEEWLNIKFRKKGDKIWRYLNKPEWTEFEE